MIYHNVNNFVGKKYNLFPYKNTFLQRALDIRIKIANYFFELYFRKIICKIKKEGVYKVFESPAKMNEWGKSHSDYFKESRKIKSRGWIANEDDKNRINELENINFYCGYVSEYVNDCLRKNRLIDIPIYKNIPFYLKSLINKFEIEDDIIVIRRIPSLVLKKENYKEGNLYKDKAFLSTSLNINYRLNYQSEERKLNKDVLCIIKVPKGTKGVYIHKALEDEGGRNEYEVLFNTETLFIVEKRRKIFNNYILNLKII